VREVDDRGALLVRPDRHIAWRSLTAVESPREALASALSTILDRTRAAHSVHYSTVSAP
jgi:2,4-dichlorophenol 6-monooxygenase